jgi:hypothetical protein
VAGGGDRSARPRTLSTASTEHSRVQPLRYRPPPAGPDPRTVRHAPDVLPDMHASCGSAPIITSSRPHTCTCGRARAATLHGWSQAPETSRLLTGTSREPELGAPPHPPLQPPLGAGVAAGVASPGRACAAPPLTCGNRVVGSVVGPDRRQTRPPELVPLPRQDTRGRGQVSGGAAQADGAGAGGDRRRGKIKIRRQGRWRRAAEAGVGPHRSWVYRGPEEAGAWASGSSTGIGGPRGRGSGCWACGWSFPRCRVWVRPGRRQDRFAPLRGRPSAGS